MDIQDIQKVELKHKVKMMKLWRNFGSSYQTYAKHQINKESFILPLLLEK